MNRYVWRLVATCFLFSFGEAEDTAHQLDCGMKWQKLEWVASAKSFDKLIQKSLFLGRFRLQHFRFNWLTADESRKDHHISALGGMLYWHTPYYRHLAFSGALFATRAFGDIGQEDVPFIKSGRDLLNLYELALYDRLGYIVPALAAVHYKKENLKLSIGRQIVQTTLLQPNDSKMIPNTFEGVTLKGGHELGGMLNTGVLWRQKLRNHSAFHSIFSYEIGVGNDDTMMHRAFTPDTLKAHRIKDQLFFLSYRSRSNVYPTFLLEAYHLPNLFTTLIVEAKKPIYYDEVMMQGSIRALCQIDRGAGAIGGASIYQNTKGYNDANSLAGALLALRLDAVTPQFKAKIGLSKVADRADIIAPWRGFPTGGYTRAMGQYNWFANTKAAMVQASFPLELKGVFDNATATVRYVRQNFDESKPAVPADNRIFNIDFFATLQNHYFRIRYGKVMMQEAVGKEDLSYHELRIEYNYLF